MTNVYVFGTEATAEAFKLTAYHFGHEVQRIGSALVMSDEAYRFILDNTYATPAAIEAGSVQADLLEAAKFARGYINTTNDGGHAALAMLNAAIEKAEGRE